MLLRKYRLADGEKPPADHASWDHVPPRGLFPSPRPNDLVTVPCCFPCNNRHSGFDERLRICASMPFDRNDAGRRILKEKVLGATLAKGRQGRFLADVAASMTNVAGRPGLVHVAMNLPEFTDGVIRSQRDSCVHCIRASTIMIRDLRHSRSFRSQVLNS